LNFYVKVWAFVDDYTTLACLRDVKSLHLVICHVDMYVVEFGSDVQEGRTSGKQTTRTERQEYLNTGNGALK
jgi:hypothetical protein